MSSKYLVRLQVKVIYGKIDNSKSRLSCIKFAIYLYSKNFVLHVAYEICKKEENFDIKFHQG